MTRTPQRKTALTPILAHCKPPSSLWAQQSNDEANVVGTPYWMAPEIIAMTGQVTAACDIWSLGCTVIEMLTGKPPYFDLQQMAAMFRIVQDEHPPMPERLSPTLEDFLIQCFQKEPTLRIDATGLLKHPWLKLAAVAPQAGIGAGGRSRNGSQVSPRGVGVDCACVWPMCCAFDDDDSNCVGVNVLLSSSTFVWAAVILLLKNDIVLHEFFRMPSLHPHVPA